MDDQKDLMDKVKVPGHSQELIEEMSKEKPITSFEELVSAAFFRCLDPPGIFVVAWHNDEIALTLLIRDINETWTESGEASLRREYLQKNFYLKEWAYVGLSAVAPPPKEVMMKFQEARARRLAALIGPDFGQWM